MSGGSGRVIVTPAQTPVPFDGARIAVPIDRTTSGDVQIPFTQIVRDDSGLYTGTANGLTVPADGFYRVSARVQMSQTGAQVKFCALTLYQAGAGVDYDVRYGGTATPQTLTPACYYEGQCDEGDFFDCAFDTGTVSSTMEGGNTTTHMEIVYLGGF